MPDEEQSPHTLDLETIGLAILTLLVDEREARVASVPGARRTEVLLSQAGLTSARIASMLEKTPGAVRMAVSRSKTSGAKVDPSSPGRRTKAKTDTVAGP
jgi:DNA-directed RNA polymerase specialized sigma24 family protein